MFKKFKAGLSVGVMANIITIIIGLITLWTSLTNHIENITIEQTQTVVSIIASDLRTRLNLYESYVLELKSENRDIPTLLIFNIKSLEDQLEDLQEWNNGE